MKILFLTTVPSPYRVDFFEELGKKCDLKVLYEEKYVNYREKSWMKINSKNYISEYLVGKFIKGKFIATNLKEKLFEDKYDFYIISGYSTLSDIMAILILKIKRKKIILSCDGAILKKENFLKYTFKRILISSANYWLSSGNITKEYLIHYGAKKERIYLYPFTSLYNEDLRLEPISKGEKVKIRKELHINHEKVILMIGQFIHRKGIDILIEATKDLDNKYGIYIIGGEPTEEYLSYIDENQIDNIYFEGFKSKNEILKYYLASDLFILPTREDIWGLVINEAMACGIPVITTDRCVAGLELINNKSNGYIIKSEDIIGLKEAINDYFSDNSNYLKMSKECIKAIEKYTVENMANVHLDIFKDINRR